MKMKVGIRHSAEMASLYQHAHKKIKDIVKLYPQYSVATIYRHCKKPIGVGDPVDKRHFNRGRPPTITPQDRRSIIRSLHRLRRTEGSFTSPRVAQEAGVCDKVTNRTVRNVMNNEGYHYCRSRKKGLLRREDLKARVGFCKGITKRKLTQNFWNENIAMYLDAKGFQFKTRPLDQARAPAAREWRKQNEGLKFGCTAKGSKEGAVNANFIVGICHSKGVILCDYYPNAITADKMVSIIKNSMPAAFDNSIDLIGRRVLMDGCPRQNAKRCLKAFEDIGALVFKIPPRSPDLNPIENFFALVTKQLRSQVIERKIEKETFEEFVKRVKSTMVNFSVEKINKIIESMSKRINMVVAEKGCRIKY